MRNKNFQAAISAGWVIIAALLILAALIVVLTAMSVDASTGKVTFRLEHPTAYPAGYRGPYQLLPVLPLHLNVKLVEGSYTYGMDDIWRCTIENEVVKDLKDVPVAYQMYLRCDGARFVITGLRFDHD